MTLFEAGPDAGWTSSGLYINLDGTFKNGTAFVYNPIPASYAVIQQGHGGISGEWKGSGIGFHGTSLNKGRPAVYTITFDVPELDIKGSVVMKSLAPPHYPCSLDIPGVTEELLPTVGWANAQPDTQATVSLSVAGTPLEFTGRGYHDKNWGTAPFSQVVQSWYWGHAYLGPYSIVWFDAQSRDGSEYFSSYITENGKVLKTSCSERASVVRPWGANSTYPPVPATGPPQGFAIDFDLGEDRRFSANITNELMTLETRGGYYQRFIGPVTGGIVGEETFEGKGLWEQFKYPLNS